VLEKIIFLKNWATNHLRQLTYVSGSVCHSKTRCINLHLGKTMISITHLFYIWEEINEKFN